MQTAVSSGLPVQKPRLMLVGPFFKPTYYGGVVQIYHQLLSHLQLLDPVIVSQRFRGDPIKMNEFDRTCAAEHGYQTVRIGRFELIFRPGASFFEKVLDIARFFRTTRREWRDLVRELRPDVIVCGATLAAGWLMDLIPDSVPLINYLHGEELGNGQWGSRYVHPYLFAQQLKAIRNADLNISVSRYTAQRASELAGIDVNHVVLLPNFVDITRFAPPTNREELRRKLGWHNKGIILSLARLTPRKGIDQAIRALAELRRDGKLSDDWLHIIAGRGEQGEELRALVGRLGVSDSTKFLGFVDESRLPEYYGAADIFLQPNRDLQGDTEGFGVVFLEANACGTAVIGGTAGGTADAIREGITGLRVDSEHIHEISRAILQLTENQELRLRMGRAGLEIVKRHHRLESGVAQFEALVLGTLRNETSRVRQTAD